MNVGERMGLFTIVPSVAPGNHSSTGTTGGDYVSLKNYQRCTVVARVGAAAGGACTLRLQQATDVSGSGAKALDVEAVWRTGVKLYFDTSTLTGNFQVGETVTGGTSAAEAEVHAVHGDHLVVHSATDDYTAEETITGGTSAVTADLLETPDHEVDEDILCRQTAAAGNTFSMPAVANKTYVLEVDGRTLDANNEFDCLQADVSVVGGTTDLAVDYVMSKPRYKNEPMLTAIYD